MSNYNVNPNQPDKLPVPGINHLRELLAVNLTNNTPDADKPVSSYQQTALNLKADLASPTFTGVVTLPAVATSDNSTKAATTSMVQARVAEAVQVAGGAVSIPGIPNNAMARITGTLTDNNEESIVFPDMLVVAANIWMTPETYPDVYYTLNPDDAVGFVLQAFAWVENDAAEAFARWESTADVATPDLVPSGAWDAISNPHAWRPISSNTGTPVVTLVPLTPAFIGQLCRVGPYPLVAGRTQPYDWYIAESVSPASWRFMNIS